MSSAVTGCWKLILRLSNNIVAPSAFNCSKRCMSVDLWPLAADLLERNYLPLLTHNGHEGWTEFELGHSRKR